MKAVEMWAKAHPEGPPQRATVDPILEPILEPDDPAASLGLNGTEE